MIYAGGLCVCVHSVQCSSSVRATQMLGTSREGRLCGSLNVLVSLIVSLSFGRTLEYALQYLSNEVLINKTPHYEKIYKHEKNTQYCSLSA